MKWKSGIISALAVLWCLLCGTALTVSADVDVTVKGTVYASSLPADTVVNMTGDTTLIVDTDKTLAAVTGSRYSLTIQGSHNLTIERDNDTAVNVKNLYSSLGGELIIISDGEPAVSASGEVSINGTAEIRNVQNSFGSAIICNGNITLSGDIFVRGGLYGLRSKNGKIEIGEGNVTVHQVWLYGNAIESHDYFSLQGGRLDVIAGGCGIVSGNGNVMLNGEAVISAEYSHAVRADKGSVAMGRKVTAAANVMPDSVAIQAAQVIRLSGGTLQAEGHSGLVAGGLIDLSGNITVTACQITWAGQTIAPGPGICSENGSIELGGTIVVNGSSAIEALNGHVTLAGTVEAHTTDTSGSYAIYARNEITDNTRSLIVSGYVLAAGKNYWLIRYGGTSDAAAIPHALLPQGTYYTLPDYPFDPPQGYYFSHWDPGYPGSQIIVTAHMLLVPRFMLDARTITFNLQGHGNAIPPRTTGAGQTVYTGPPNPSADGYLFEGWYREADCVNKFTFPAVITENITLYAKWTRVYTISFDANGGTGSAAERRIIAGNSFTLPGNLYFTAPAGKQFHAWYIEYGVETVYGKKVFHPQDVVQPVSSFTVQALWSNAPAAPERVTLDFLPGEGVSGSSFTQEGWYVDANSSTRFTMPEPSSGWTIPEHRLFDQWKAEWTGENGQSLSQTYKAGQQVRLPYTTDHHIRLTAQWKNTPRYFVSFWNTFASGTAFHREYVYEGETVTGPASDPPDLESYVFDGWYTDRNCTTAFDRNTPIMENTNLFSKWTARSALPKCNVTFTAGTGTSAGDLVFQVVKNSEYVLPPLTAGWWFTPPASNGEEMAFDGWQIGSYVYYPGEVIWVSSDITIRARWKEYPAFAFTPDSSYMEGGTLTIDVESMAEQCYPMRAAIEENRITYSWLVNGYADYKNNSVSFPVTGEYLNDTVTAEIEFSDGASPTYRRIRSETFTVLPSVCTVTFDTGGGTPVPAQSVVNGEQAAVPDVMPTKEEGGFLGWYRSLWDSEPFDFNTPITDHITLYAMWKDLHAYSITPVPMEHGTVILSADSAVGGSIVTVEAVPDPGYRVERIHYMYEDKVLGTVTDGTLIMPTYDINIAAIFTPLIEGITEYLSLPDGLTTIEADAFINTAAEAVIIPDSVYSISGNPFAGSSVRYICGTAGSVAETFANQYGYTFITV